MSHPMDWGALARIALVYLHLLAFAAAAIAIAFGDQALFARRRLQLDLLRSASRGVIAALALLWLSGLALVLLDSGGDWARLRANDKLQAKLIVVLLLSLNGWLLHRYGFPRLQALTTSSSQALRRAGLPSLLGALSACSWLCAAFLGVSKPPLAQALGLGGLLSLYLLGLAAALPLAWTWVRPRLAQRLLLRQEPPPPHPGRLDLLASAASRI